MKNNLEKKPLVTFGKFENIDMRVVKVIEAPMAQDTKSPCRVFKLDAGVLGTIVSVGQFALLPEEKLVGKNVVACVNLGSRQMGPYISEALVMGAPHPESPEDQSQATPLFVDSGAIPGSRIF